MLSLVLQIVLIFFAPFRKRSHGIWLHRLLWLAYLGADYISTLALGSILTDRYCNVGADLTKQTLTAFWAPFLLVHLGGPDNITSYSVEDNELWLRHFFGVVVQVSVALVVLVLSMMKTTRLLVPSILIFIAGIIKFGERTFALRAASTKQIKNSAVKKDQLAYLVSTYRDVSRPDAQSNGETLSDISDAKFILLVYCYFLIFKPHIVGTLVTSAWQIRHLRMHNKEDIGFRFISIELSFFYDILHTKATVVHRMACRVIRIASLVSIMIAFYFFHTTEKRGHESSDLIITYTLLSVALFLEFYSALHLVISKWTVISLLRLNKKWTTTLAKLISRVENHIFCLGNKGQWSERMGQYSLIKAVMKNKESNRFKKAWDFLFEGEESAKVSKILEKTVIKHAKNLVEPLEQYGEYVDLITRIRSSWISNSTLDRYNLTEIKNKMKEETFEQSIMLWHMVTDICYFVTNNAPRNSEQGQMREALYRLSNYMMYLLMEIETINDASRNRRNYNGGNNLRM
ncbi:hypothetical protein LUZ62_058749 [Rhynchospora pubera]|uniref:DUF4220 domain-containing protein n=1 Tax=Rhynchospora pubera TaxID=906938 RepID=A0AAV8E6K7_9POAL|nr:hypothetical protein LUZ62_058749 [Rhynchospora pubera]